MEITMNDVIAFVDNAMSRNLDMFVGETYIRIRKETPEDIEYIEFTIFVSDKSFLKIEKGLYGLNSYKIKDLSDIDVQRFKLECARAAKYAMNKTREFFWDFFKEDEKPPTINDLDSEDD